LRSFCDLKIVLDDNKSVSCNTFELVEWDERESGCEFKMPHSISAFFPQQMETRQRISIKTCSLLTTDIELPEDLEKGDQSDSSLSLSDIQALYRESLTLSVCVIC
jgi:hypothetical protein